MDSDSKISVIVPVYNVSQYLHRSIKSLLTQTYTNLEIILIDDGSKDTSGTICDSYASQYKNVIVRHQNNSGVSFARNRGLELATGDYIGFLDPDDYVDSDMYACLLENLLASNADIAVCYWDDYFHNKHKACSLVMYDDTLSREDAIYRDIDAGMYSVCNKLYSKYTIWNVWFDEKYINGEDRLFFIQAYSNANRIKYVDKELYHYCHRTNSAGTKEFTARDYLLIEVCKRIQDICFEIAPKALSVSDLQIDIACLSLLRMMNYDIDNYPPYGQLVLNDVRKRWRKAISNPEASFKHLIKMTAMSLHPAIVNLLSKVKACLD